ncbi:uncharacterized protein PADG_02740 [Paracoccidioides brasiliensis Pb18]|uniref:3-hydroxyacyl-CoA dehydrogenase NAD binding domain-containing protein n=1 Tax=Paracoccidioides brasiliensis (strain Pb18) TaxID=502780 RepID=C1G6D5_PARBD|nr:uncharacterized protein PADG_02740 [Paracoccidioides brasiliensis Pb18]EEH46642.2 hypothetical protein PADG_02740 [Paracoccidioides brasiliensis Pb18]
MSAISLPKPTRIAPIGSETTGLSFATLHLTQSPDAEVTIYDTRPDLKAYIKETLPGYLSTLCPTQTLPSLHSSDRLTLAADLATAVSTADIIQEQGPETPLLQTVHLATTPPASPASTQAINMRDKSRLIVVHPYNPPHIMPLLELVPGSNTTG